MASIPASVIEFEPDDNFFIERDVAVPMRDGVKLYADIIRPKTDAKVPVILTYSPYGKHGLKKFLLSPQSGVPAGWVSKYAVWEGPDPVYFVPHGYAVMNADARGSWYSEGDLTTGAIRKRGTAMILLNGPRSSPGVRARSA